MSSVKERVAKVLSEPQMAVLSTITEEGKPWCRYVMAFADAQMNIRFATFENSRKVRQIKSNSEVHLTCGVNDPATARHYLQIEGKASISTDQEVKNLFWNPMFESIFKGPQDPEYAVITIKPTRIEYSNMGSMEPEILEL